MERMAELYRGKAKTVYTTDDPEMLIIHFRNDTTAFDGLKIEQLEDKGRINNLFNFFIMKKLEEQGVPTQIISLVSDNELLVKKLQMIPLECVVRNVSTGSVVKRFGVSEGIELNPPTFEFFLKSDTLHDPLVNDSLILSFGWATQEQIELMRKYSLQVNDILKKLFADAGLLLVDYKLEFGMTSDGKLTLGDEFSPDGCRLWDIKTRKKLDKDRFRQGLGGVIEAYKEVASRIGCEL